MHAVSSNLTRRLIVLMILLYAGFYANAQVIKGRITDANGQPVYNASLFIRELRMGTAANDNGYYELRVPQGVYVCVFQSMGYENQTILLEVGELETVEYNVTLIETAFSIPELFVSNNRGEDPAYAMMRRAIAMAPFYLNQVSEYKAEVYLKGTLHVGRISPLLKRLAQSEDLNLREIEGNTYLEESFNEIEFIVPNHYKQTIVRKTGSMPVSEDNNAMTLITASIYDENAFNPIISPLSTSAFAHYRFSYEGFFLDDDRIINKIRIIPRRNSKQLFSGYVYIADGYWNVHSADVSGELIMGITFRMQINFGEVNENVWMPVSHHFNFDASVLGNSGSFHYVASIKYTELIENTALRKPDALLLAQQQRLAQQQLQAPPTELSERSAQPTRTSERIENLLDREDLTNRQAYQLARLMQRESETEKRENQSLDLTEELRRTFNITVDSAANVRDTAFWEKMRPVPLNTEEIRSYQQREHRLATQQQKRDTVQSAADSKQQSTSTSRKILLGTNNVSLGKQGSWGNIRYRGLLNPSQIGFNTVDGFYIGQRFTYNKNFSQQRQISITPEATWAINRKTLMWEVDAWYAYAPMRRGRTNIRFGHKSSDFSDLGMHDFENTIASLFFRQNYLKLYDNNFVSLGNMIDIANGLQLTTNVRFSRRVMLDNNSDFSFFYNNGRQYSPNEPVNIELVVPLINHNHTSLAVNFAYTPRLYYRIVGKRKHYVRSDFPTFFAGWRKGLNGVMGSSSNYDHAWLGISQTLKAGLMQEFSYGVFAGSFINNKTVHFPDFAHFKTIEIPFSIKTFGTGSYKLLEYYRYSASDKHVQAHFVYQTPFLFLKFLPYFSNRILWKESVQLNYLYTPGLKNYLEPSYTIGMLPAWEIGVFAGFSNFKYRSWGFKASLALNP